LQYSSILSSLIPLRSFSSLLMLLCETIFICSWINTYRSLSFWEF
jgi:hypothetical protein